jgi:hypothetical protein
MTTLFVFFFEKSEIIVFHRCDGCWLLAGEEARRGEASGILRSTKGVVCEVLSVVGSSCCVIMMRFLGIFFLAWLLPKFLSSQLHHHSEMANNDVSKKGEENTQQQQHFPKKRRVWPRAKRNRTNSDQIGSDYRSNSAPKVLRFKSFVEKVNISR